MIRVIEYTHEESTDSKFYLKAYTAQEMLECIKGERPYPTDIAAQHFAISPHAHITRNQIKRKVIEMTEEQFNKLPEFDG